MDFCVNKTEIKWKTISDENLNLMYAPHFLSTSVADNLFKILESNLEYFTGDLAKVKVYGKWHPIPRQQVQF